MRRASNFIYAYWKRNQTKELARDLGSQEIVDLFVWPLTAFYCRKQTVAMVAMVKLHTRSGISPNSSTCVLNLEKSISDCKIDRFENFTFSNKNAQF